MTKTITSKDIDLFCWITLYYSDLKSMITLNWTITITETMVIIFLRHRNFYTCIQISKTIQAGEEQNKIVIYIMSRRFYYLSLPVLHSPLYSIPFPTTYTAKV